MANNENLIPNINRTPEELREITRKGGIRSGEVRKAKKEFHERITAAMEIVNKKALSTAKDDDVKKIINEIGLDGYEIISILSSSLSSKKLKMEAINMLWDRQHGKPKQNIEATNRNFDSDIDLTDISTENLETMAKMTPEELQNLSKNIETKKDK